MGLQSIAWELAQIRVKELKHRKVPIHSSGALKLLSARIKFQIQKKQILEVYRDSRGRAYAAVLFCKEPVFFSDQKFSRCIVLCDPSKAEAKRWTMLMLWKHQKRITSGMLGNIDPCHREILKLLGKLSLNIDMIVLAGNTQRSLRALHKTYGDLSLAKHRNDLIIRPMASLADVEQTISIIRREFRKNPQFGWFVDHPEHLRREKEQYQKSIKRKIKTHFVVTSTSGQVLGQFGFEIIPKSILGGKTASLIFNFDHFIQGRGLAKFAYFHLLSQLEKMKIDNFMGSTAQKPVMILSRVMKRVAISYDLRAAPTCFSPRYFRYL